MTVKGYVSGGQFAKDLQRWFGEGQEIDDVKPIDRFAAKLATAHRPALEAFDALVRTSAVPPLHDFELAGDWTYGFDFAQNDCQVIDVDEETELTSQVWALGSNGGGDLYVLKLDGSVAIWSHEQSTLEQGSGFADLDELLWTVTHLAAVEQSKLPLEEVREVIDALKSDGPALFLRQIVKAATARSHGR